MKKILFAITLLFLALLGARGFRQVGGLYGSAGEALAAWRNQ